ncbi:antitoxin ParD1/3/4 [Methylobacterium phyllostachyos]|uniref:Antitoxin ParD1/3/4 n=1 Tax=Methylobacterium phyllostachyos TaxID=582672 RepID=A0A1G9U171_9HYPH|nr:type II toxin-antitoxin system ParD family antitoxin [Methylobacterium phyllostachyos]SDM53404.1 antitoxin ParD1/3/4 [Methylobacterium phyllostachyos]
MSLRRTITVSITEEQDTLLRDCLQSGRFGSVSEVVRAALRLLDRDETPALEALRAKQTREETRRD